MSISDPSEALGWGASSSPEDRFGARSSFGARRRPSETRFFFFAFLSFLSFFVFALKSVLFCLARACSFVRRSLLFLADFTDKKNTRIENALRAKRQGIQRDTKADVGVYIDANGNVVRVQRTDRVGEDSFDGTCATGRVVYDNNKYYYYYYYHRRRIDNVDDDGKTRRGSH